MTTKIEAFIKPYLKKDLPDIRPGDLVKVYQKIKEGDKERVQAFDGRVIARKHGKGISATITVRRITGGIGVEKIFPLHLSTIEKIEILERGKVRRAKLYYLRGVKKKKTRLKRKEFVRSEVKEEPKEFAESSASIQAGKEKKEVIENKESKKIEDKKEVEEDKKEKVEE